MLMPGGVGEKAARFTPIPIMLKSEIHENKP